VTAAPDRPPGGDRSAEDARSTADVGRAATRSADAVAQPAQPEDDQVGGGTPACTRCGGSLVPGALVMPILGRAKFAYSLRGRSIETDVDAQMCSDCGLVTFTAQDPQRIRRARDADRYAAAPRDGPLRRTTRERLPGSGP